MLYELLYTSLAKWEMSSNELIELLEKSREKNKLLNITGLLVYHNREFVQIIEGEKETVLELYDIITKDERHTSVRTFWENSISKRGFSKWAMGFIKVENLELSTLNGYPQFLKEGFSSGEITSIQTKGKKLILSLTKRLIQREQLLRMRKTGPR
jgi:hypothetical protein